MPRGRTVSKRSATTVPEEPPQKRTRGRAAATKVKVELVESDDDVPLVEVKAKANGTTARKSNKGKAIKTEPDDAIPSTSNGVTTQRVKRGAATKAAAKIKKEDVESEEDQPVNGSAKKSANKKKSGVEKAPKKEGS